VVVLWGCEGVCVGVFVELLVLWEVPASPWPSFRGNLSVNPVSSAPWSVTAG